MGSHSTVETLVKMANEIGDFFGAQRGADRSAGVVEHITKFWDPRMRANIIAHLEHGGEGLSPIALEAVKRIAEGAKQRSDSHERRESSEHAGG